ncbi:MAG: hypothetical protein ACTSQN_12640 [Candidatus Heimdallarchaeota archaeon]
MKKIAKEDWSQYNSIEQLTMDKKSTLDINYIEKYPSFLRELGDLIYQAKYSPNVLQKWIDPASYFEFGWYIYSEEIVLSHAFFEAFLTKTIEVICKSSPKIMIDFLDINDTRIDLTKKKIFDKQFNRLNRKIGGKSFERRLKFFNEHCDLSVQINNERINGLYLFEQIRHLIVHRNGIIDEEYIRKMKKLGFNEERKLGINKKIKLTEDYSKAHRHVTRMFAIELYVNTCKKYLKDKG